MISMVMGERAGGGGGGVVSQLQAFLTQAALLHDLAGSLACLQLITIESTSSTAA